MAAVQPTFKAGVPSGADTVYAIEAANPELADVIKTLKTTFAVLGGRYTDTTGDLNLKTFDGRRTFILSDLHRLEVQCDTKMNAGLNPRSKDYIRLKLQIEKGMSGVMGHVKELKKIIEKDAKKGLAPAEETRRREELGMLAREITRVKALARGEITSGADAETAPASMGGVRVLAPGDLTEGKPGAPPRRVVQESMTAQQQAQLTQVRVTMREQDSLLDDINVALDGLMETVTAIGDEVDAQTQMLADTEDHMNKTQNTLDGVNERLDRTLAIANEKSTAFCSYAICIMILLGLGTVVYNVVVG